MAFITTLSGVRWLTTDDTRNATQIENAMPIKYSPVDCTLPDCKFMISSSVMFPPFD
ncbi:MAG: hypothetical protein ACPG2A_05705 [Parvibaculales bacterium]